MKRSKRVIAGVTAAWLLFTPAVAFATETEPAPAVSQNANTTEQTQYVKVMILTHNQPTRPGSELVNLRAVNKLRDHLVAKYGIKPDRSFGYLVKGLAAMVPEDKLAEIAAEPDVASVERTREYKPLMGTAGDLTFSTDARKEHGVDGQGIVVSIIDTGIDIHHQDMILDSGAKTKLTAAAGFTTKVPWGYNYADDNNEVKDLTSSQHGMHVAGIVAANGGAADASPYTNGRINGVAPNAQLLAMKVFPNESSKGVSASTEDIIAALEDSVKHKADIINMSLGSPNGFSGTTEGEQRAVKVATDAGVEVIVAAGNEGLNFSASGVTDDVLGLLDDGTVGSPATATTALAVASVDNVSSVSRAARAVQADTQASFSYSLQTGVLDGNPHRVVYGGLGKPGEVPDNARGAYVLIERGEIAFSKKFQEAVKKGAIGVIVYNHASGGETIPGMAGIDGFDIVGVGMTHSAGERLKAMIEKGETTLVFTDDLEPNPVSSAKTPSDFSSWGSTSSLDFKPQIAGIGGEVWSTFNDNEYENSSGTSMAAPHVAGVTALVLQKAKEKYAGLTPNELNELNRIALANTAQVLKNDAGVPFSPRQMGAGLVNTKAAIETDVFATVDNSPWVALKEVQSAESFTVKLQNKGLVDREYQVGATCVVNETNLEGEKTQTECNPAETLTADANTVTVPAGGTASVTYTLTPDATEAHWLGAWSQFTSTDPKVPTLSVPVLGFAGDWNAERIIDAPLGNPSVFDVLFENPDDNRYRTQLTTRSITGNEVAYKDGSDFWISPNGDQNRDNLLAKVVLLRNAKEIRGSIVDSTGKVLRELGKESFVSRHSVTEYQEQQPNVMHDLAQISFDGRIYNKKIGDFEYLADGEYTYRLAAKLDDSFAPQLTEMKFKVDTVKPTVQLDEIKVDEVTKDVTVTFTASDSGSGLGFTGITLNGLQSIPAELNAENKLELQLPAHLLSNIRTAELYVTDLAGNEYAQKIKVTPGHLDIDAEEEWELEAIGPKAKSGFYDELIVKDGVRRISGEVTEPVNRITVNGQEVTLVDGRFDTSVAVTENDENTVVVRGYGGSQPEVKTFTFTYDAADPTVELFDAQRDDASGLYTITRDENMEIHLRGRVTDNLAEPEVYLTVVGVSDEEELPVINEEFTYQAEVPEHASLVLLEVTDGVNSTSELIRISNGVFNPESTLIFGDLKTADINIVTKDDANVTQRDGKYFYNWEGILSAIPQTLQIQGNDVEFSATTGEFVYEIELAQGITPVNLKLIDTKGNVIHDTSLRILFDSVLPVYTLEEGKPAINPDGAIYLKEAGEIQFKGTVADNAFGYAMALNGNIIENVLSIFDPTVEATTRTFDRLETGEDGDIFLLGLYDQFGNYTERQIPIVVDATLPTATVSGIEDGATYKVPFGQKTLTKQVTVTANDAHLKGLNVTLNGEKVATKVVKAVPHPKASFVQEGDDATGKRLGDGSTPLDPGRASNLEEPIAEVSVTAETTVDEATAPNATAVADAVSERAAVVAAADATGNVVAAETPETELAVTVEVEAPIGDNTLIVEAGDKAGNVNATTVAFKVEEATAVPAEVKVTAKGKTLTATLTGEATVPEGVKLTIEATAEGNVNTFMPKADMVFPVNYALVLSSELGTVEYILPDGTIETPKLVKTDGKYTFTAPSNAVIRVITANRGTNPSVGSNNSGPKVDTNLPPVGVPITDGVANGKSAKTPVKDTLTNTGTNSSGTLLLSAILLVAGIALLALRRRQH